MVFIDALEKAKSIVDVANKIYLDDYSRDKLQSNLTKIDSVLNLNVLVDYVEVNIRITSDCARYLFVKNTDFERVTKEQLQNLNHEQHRFILKQMKTTFEAVLKKGFYLELTSSVLGIVGTCVK